MQPLVDQMLMADSHYVDGTIRTAHRLYEHLIALWAPAIIEAAYELGVFRVLSEEATDSVTLSKKLETDPRCTRILLEALYTYGFVERIDGVEEAKRYALSAELKHCFLPGGLYSLVGKMVYDRRLAWDAWRNLASTIRASGEKHAYMHQQNQISDHDYEFLVGGINFFAPPCVDQLCQALQNLSWETDRAVSVLDIGCGTGLYSQLLLQRFPRWIATGLDHERIAPLAHTQSVQLGVDDRFTSLACDFWEVDWKSGFDLIIFANIFHLQNYQSNQQLLIRASQSLAPGGLICIIDYIVDDDRNVDSPQNRFAFLFAASMLATGGGDSYSLSDYHHWLNNSGLQPLHLLNTPMHRILLAGHV